jgi:hypothetical protein
MARVRKKKPYLLTALLGIISLGSYFMVFSNQEPITEYTTRGALYAALPIAAAFYFSFVHGAFSSNVLSIFGIEAKKKNK